MKRNLLLMVVCALLVSPAFGADKAAVQSADALDAKAHALEHKARLRQTSAADAKKLMEEAKVLREQAREARLNYRTADANARQARMAKNREAQQAITSQRLQQQLERQQLLNSGNAGLPISQLPVQTSNGIVYYPVQRVRNPGNNVSGVNGFIGQVNRYRSAVYSVKNLANSFRSFGNIGW